MKTKPVYVFICSVLFFMLLHECCVSHDKKAQKGKNQDIMCKKKPIKPMDDFCTNQSN